jgi:hypothetical protein
MTNVKTLSAVLILSAAIATPAFAHTKHHNRLSDYRGAYNQLGSDSIQAQRNLENFGFSGRDPSRVGGFDPSLNPSGS